MADAVERPWYRQFWLWFVLAPVIATVIAGIATLMIAGHEPALAVDDPGQISRAVEHDRQRDLRAVELGLTAELQFDAGPAAGEQRADLRMSIDVPGRLRLDLIHPTREDRDESAVLVRSGDGYRGTVMRRPGRLYLRVGDEQGTWRLTGELAPGQRTVRLAPAP